MPYISQTSRQKYEPELGNLRRNMSWDIPKGDLTYLVYCLSFEYINKTGYSYTNISNAISALNDAAEEMRQKILNPYENSKQLENGDIK